MFENIGVNNDFVIGLKEVEKSIKIINENTNKSDTVKKNEIGHLYAAMKIAQKTAPHWIQLKSIVSNLFKELNHVGLVVKKKDVADYMMQWLDHLDALGGFESKSHDFRIHKAEEYYRKILQFDYTEPENIFKTFERLYASDHLMCIRIKNKIFPKPKKNEKGEKIYSEFVDIGDHIIIEQLKNIKRHYFKYGGGIEFEIIEGNIISSRKGKSLYMTSDKFRTYY